MSRRVEPEVLLRAARLASLPGVSRAEACSRFGVSAGALRRALATFAVEAAPSRRDLVLHALSDGGSRTAGPLPPMASVASWCDHVNRDGTTPGEVAAIIDELAASGALAVEGGEWRLLRDFP